MTENKQKNDVYRVFQQKQKKKRRQTMRFVSPGFLLPLLGNPAEYYLNPPNALYPSGHPPFDNPTIPVVLDIHCGIGYSTHRLHRFLQNKTVTLGCDPSPQNIRIAKTLYPDCSFSSCDVSDMILPPDSFCLIQISLDDASQKTNKVWIPALKNYGWIYWYSRDYKSRTVQDALSVFRCAPNMYELCPPTQNGHHHFHGLFQRNKEKNVC